MPIIEVSNGKQRQGTSVELHEAEPQAHEIQYVQAIRNEIDSYFGMLKQLNEMPSEEIFATLSAITARLAELRTLLWRSDSRRYSALRTREIEPLLETTERLFRIHSRSFAVATQEYDAMRGQV